MIAVHALGFHPDRAGKVAKISDKSFGEVAPPDSPFEWSQRLGAFITLETAS